MLPWSIGSWEQIGSCGRPPAITKGVRQTTNHKSAATTNFHLPQVMGERVCLCVYACVFINKTPKGNTTPLQSNMDITPLNILAWAWSCLWRNTAKSIISNSVILQGVWLIKEGGILFLWLNESEVTVASVWWGFAPDWKTLQVDYLEQ